jgi:hypothetical protein
MLEAMNTTANHDLLRNLAKTTKGRFYSSDELNKLADFLKTNTTKSIIHSNEEFVELVNLPWLFFLILALISTEWFIRRYRGGY